MSMMNWAEKEVAIACANERKGSGKKTANGIMDVPAMKVH